MAGLQNVSVDVRLVAKLPWIWLHTDCGNLNHGRWHAGDNCGGCGDQVMDDSVTHLYLLVDAKPIGDD